MLLWHHWSQQKELPLRLLLLWRIPHYYHPLATLKLQAGYRDRAVCAPTTWSSSARLSYVSSTGRRTACFLYLSTIQWYQERPSNSFQQIHIWYTEPHIYRPIIWNSKCSYSTWKDTQEIQWYLMLSQTVRSNSCMTLFYIADSIIWWFDFFS